MGAKQTAKAWMQIAQDNPVDLFWWHGFDWSPRECVLSRFFNIPSKQQWASLERFSCVNSENMFKDSCYWQMGFLSCSCAWGHCWELAYQDHIPKKYSSTSSHALQSCLSRFLLIMVLSYLWLPHFFEDSSSWLAREYCIFKVSKLVSLCSPGAQAHCILGELHIT